MKKLPTPAAARAIEVSRPGSCRYPQNCGWQGLGFGCDNMLCQHMRPATARRLQQIFRRKA